jgi:disulfide bond formation protein DsbB
MSTFSQIKDRWPAYIALVTAWTAMLGSLYFSEVKGYVPCQLCWYQRIFMYPLTAILAVGLLRQSSDLPYYVLPLSLIGQGISTYHYLLQKTTLFSGVSACSTGVPCNTMYINWFGFVTIPFLAMTAFFIITVMGLLELAAGEPEELEEPVDQPTPWLPVAGAIALVLVVFGVIFLRGTQPTPAIAMTEVAAGDSTPAGSSDPTAADLDEGRLIFLQSCAACHGMDARGMEHLGNSLVDSEIVLNSSDAEIIAFLRAGVGLDDPRNTSGLVMPPSGGRPNLSDEELLNVVRYIRTQ